MPRSSLHKLLTTLDAMDYGWTVTTMTSNFETIVYLFDPANFVESVKQRDAAPSAFSWTNQTVGIVAFFGSEGNFIAGGKLVVRFDGNAAYLATTDTGQWRRSHTAYPTLKSVLVAAGQFSPAQRESRKRQEEAAHAATVARAEAFYAALTAVGQHEQVQSWVDQFGRETLRQEAEIVSVLQGMSDLALQKIEEIKARPGGYIGDTFLPGHSGGHAELHARIAAHNARLQAPGPFTVLLHRKETNDE